MEVEHYEETVLLKAEMIEERDAQIADLSAKQEEFKMLLVDKVRQLVQSSIGELKGVQFTEQLEKELKTCY